MNANKNPCNVKYANPNNRSIQWKGSSGYDGRGHAIFETAADGFRAAMRNLQSCWNNGHRTLASICAQWADSGDTQGSIPGNAANDPVDYAHYVAEKIRIAVNEPLPNPIEDPCLWVRIGRVMARYEMGCDLDWSDALAGGAKWAMYFIEGKK